MDELTALWIESLKKSGEGYLRVKGKSMEPTLKMGEKVLVKEIKPQAIKNDEIIVFTADEEIIAHRIVDKFRFSDKLYFVHRGDKAGIFGMSIFAEDQLVGRAETCGLPSMSLRANKVSVAISGLLHFVRNDHSSQAIADYLLRKFFIYFFILKQLLKKTLRIQTDRGTDANR